jgi:hypothetical protein
MCRGSYHLRSTRNGPAVLATKNAAVGGSGLWRIWLLWAQQL